MNDSTKIIDALAWAIAPAYVATGALVTYFRSDTSVGELDAVLTLLIGVPWTCALPALFAMWMRHVGIPTPGARLRGAMRAPRRGGPALDLLLVLLAPVASWPLLLAHNSFSANDIGTDPLLALLTLAASPAIILVGSIYTWLTPPGPVRRSAGTGH